MLRNGMHDLDENGHRGDWCFENDDKYIVIKYGETWDDMIAVPITGEKSWTWNGDKEKPTLSPSIRVKKENGWHGFLENGVLRDA